MERDAVARLERAVLDRDSAQAKEAQARRESGRLLDRLRAAEEEGVRREAEAVAGIEKRLGAALEESEERGSMLQERLTETETRAESAENRADAVE